jgi:hypothetical protein
LSKRGDTHGINPTIKSRLTIDHGRFAIDNLGLGELMEQISALSLE